MMEWEIGMINMQKLNLDYNNNEWIKRYISINKVSITNVNNKYK